MDADESETEIASTEERKLSTYPLSSALLRSSVRVEDIPFFGANVDFPKYFEKYDSLVRKEKFPEIYHTCVDANDTDA